MTMAGHDGTVASAGNFPGYARASHYILNYQKISGLKILRIEAFYKEYNQLLKTMPALSISGEGFDNGIELFWRDRGAITNMDDWLSYSYLDSEREYQNFSGTIHPREERDGYR